MRLRRDIERERFTTLLLPFFFQSCSNLLSCSLVYIFILLFLSLTPVRPARGLDGLARTSTSGVASRAGGVVSDFNSSTPRSWLPPPTTATRIHPIATCCKETPYGNARGMGLAVYMYCFFEVFSSTPSRNNACRSPIRSGSRVKGST
jgi:hypothetical protein